MNTRILFVEHSWQGVAIAFRNLIGQLTLNEIDELFHASGYYLKDEHKVREQDLTQVLAQRKARAQVYLERIDWKYKPESTFPPIMRRLDSLLRKKFPTEATMLEQDVLGEFYEIGYEFIENWQLIPINNFLVDIATPTSSEGIEVEIQRLIKMMQDIDSDPHAVLGKTKDLVEATCKTVITECGGIFDSKVTFSQLGKMAEEYLGLDKNQNSASEMNRHILGGLRSTFTAIMHIRNKVKGSGGHGSQELETGIEPHFARAVADAGVAWIRFMLSELENKRKR